MKIRKWSSLAPSINLELFIVPVSVHSKTFCRLGDFHPTVAQEERTYDLLGAEIRRTGHAIEHRTFDAEGRLTEIKRSGLYVTYGYDALGRRAVAQNRSGHHHLPVAQRRAAG